MTDLIAFLEARLAEDEQLARAAEAEPFPDKGFQRGTHIAYGLQSTGLGLDYQGFALMWDPARVLAEVAAKRAIIRLHSMMSYPERWGEVRHHPGDKATAPGSGWALRMSARSHFGELTGGSVYACSICDADRDYGYIPRAEPGCETLLAVAAPYAGYGDFDENWRIDLPDPPERTTR